MFIISKMSQLTGKTTENKCQKDKIYDWEMFVYVLFKNVFNLFRTVKFENDAEISVGGLNDDALLFNTYLLPNQSASQ